MPAELSREIQEQIEKSEAPLLKRELSRDAQEHRRKVVNRVQADVYEQIDAILAEAAVHNKQLTAAQAAEALRTKLQRRYEELNGRPRAQVADVVERTNISEVVAPKETHGYRRSEVAYITRQLEELRKLNL